MTATARRAPAAPSALKFWVGIAMIVAGVSLAMFYAGLVVGNSVDGSLPPWAPAALLTPALILGLAGGSLQRRNR